MIISEDTDKAFDKNSTSSRVEGNYSIKLKVIYKKPSANITLSGEEFKVFPLI